MKTRVRSARYQDVLHIEAVIQEIIENADEIPLPPIERPHIYNYLNYHIPRGELFISITDEKISGVGIIEINTYPWNEHQAVLAGMIIIRKGFHAAGAQAMLLIEMANHAHRNNLAMIFQAIPGMDTHITESELALIGATVRDGAVIFLPKNEMEKAAE